MCVGGGGGACVDPGTDNLMPSSLFLHLVLTHFLRFGEPISGVIFSSPPVGWTYGIRLGGMQELSAVRLFSML